MMRRFDWREGLCRQGRGGRLERRQDQSILDAHIYGDKFDAMGTGFAATGSFGFITPGLNALFLDRLGWLSPSRVASFNGVGDSSFPWSQTITLAALNRPEANGYLALRITANGKTAVFEFRSRSG
jgi:hypothetical protein